MDLVSALAPPRFCRLGGEDLWVRPFALEDYALLLAWLDDVLPAKSDRKTPPRLGDPESQAALDTAHGKVLTAYAGLRHLGYGYKRAEALACRAGPEEWATYLAAVFSRRRTIANEVDGSDLDIAQVWFGPNFASICERYPGHTLEAIGRLSLDQYALLCGKGLEHEDPRELSAEQVEAMRLEGLRLQAEREKAEANGSGT